MIDQRKTTKNYWPTSLYDQPTENDQKRPKMINQLKKKIKTAKNDQPIEDNQKQPKNDQKLAHHYTERDGLPVSVWIGQDFQMKEYISEFQFCV